ncbi:MAG: hypothetical protein ACQ9ET_00650 [Nitrosomonadaceae bacterium]
MTDREKFALKQSRTPRNVPTVKAAPDWLECYSELIHDGVLFAEGFGFVEVDGEWIPINHTGGMYVGENVEVFPGTTLVRATAKDKQTEIHDGTKIDCGCHIAHNCIIGSNVVICAHTNIGGSTVINDDVYIANGVTIRNKIKICKGAKIGTGAVVVSDVTEPGVWYVGNPAKPIK